MASTSVARQNLENNGDRQTEREKEREGGGVGGRPADPHTRWQARIPGFVLALGPTVTGHETTAVAHPRGKKQLLTLESW